MSETELLKQNIIQSLDQADEKVLRMIQSILQIEQEHDFWDDLPKEIRDEVDEALLQADKGIIKGKPHDEVMKKYL
ncbi:MAG: hypothetical protein EOP42_26465 [Sphingobacteriaceae bacterium]|nr:MAG: hypothetical protein EOP42_26465 [Sphingobacteriaceae bacterium]